MASLRSGCVQPEGPGAVSRLIEAKQVWRRWERGDVTRGNGLAEGIGSAGTVKGLELGFGRIVEGDNGIGREEQAGGAREVTLLDFGLDAVREGDRGRRRARARRDGAEDRESSHVLGILVAEGEAVGETGSREGEGVEEGGAARRVI
jgi:hypothetical protein